MSSEDIKELTQEQRIKIAQDLVHQISFEVMELINSKVKDSSLMPDEKWLTMHRIVNRIYIHMNTVVFNVVAKVAEAGDL